MEIIKQIYWISVFHCKTAQFLFIFYSCQTLFYAYIQIQRHSVSLTPASRRGNNKIILEKMYYTQFNLLTENKNNDVERN